MYVFTYITHVKRKRKVNVYSRRLGLLVSVTSFPKKQKQNGELGLETLKFYGEKKREKKAVLHNTN